jgi:hypothetical protein
LCYVIGVHIPPWLTLLFASVVILFGGYRMYLATRKRDPEADKDKRSMMGGGFYRMSPRAHAAVGLIYLALGGCLIATTFGWNPFGSSSTEEAPAKPDKPAGKHGPVPVEVAPPANK